MTLAWPLVASGQASKPIVTSGTSLPAPLAGLVDEALARFTIGPEADEADEERELRRAERAVLELLATEGYFEPTLRFEPGGTARYRLIIELGRRTSVGALDLQFTGALNEPRFQERAAALRAEWPLPIGAPFRSPQWETAKTQLLAAVQARDFAGAKLVDSAAKVNADDATAALTVQIDSGPAYTVGELQITGLERYDAKLVQRYNPFKVGERFDRAEANRISTRRSRKLRTFHRCSLRYTWTRPTPTMHRCASCCVNLAPSGSASASVWRRIPAPTLSSPIGSR